MKRRLHNDIHVKTYCRQKKNREVFKKKNCYIRYKVISIYIQFAQNANQFFTEAQRILFCLK